MTFPQIRRLIDSLMLKYADEVEAYRLRPVAQRFCEDLARAVTGKKPGRPRSIGEWTQIFLGGPRNAASNSRARLPQRLPGSLPRPSRPAPGQWLLAPRPQGPPAAASSPAPSKPPSPSDPPLRFDRRPVCLARPQGLSKVTLRTVFA